MTLSPSLGHSEAVLDEDRRLLEDCLAGRPEAWEAFVRRFAPPLAAACRRTLIRCSRPASPLDVDDMLQAVFLGFVERDMKVLRTYRGQGRVVTYLSAVAICRVLDDRTLETRGASARLRERADPAPGPAELAEARDAQAQARGEVEKLPAKARLAVLLQSEGASLKEIGRALGVSEDAAAQLLSRSRATLRDRLK